jgi:His-Xaa-Ser system protein HxsD
MCLAPPCPRLAARSSRRQLQWSFRIAGDAMSSSCVEFEEGCARATIDLQVYGLAAVKKAAYRIADRCTATVGSPGDDGLVIDFMFPPGTSGSVAREAVRFFFQELLDQELREQIARETAPVRALILAMAFSKTDLIRKR